jgi:hypothetical protein
MVNEIEYSRNTFSNYPPIEYTDKQVAREFNNIVNWIFEDFGERIKKIYLVVGSYYFEISCDEKEEVRKSIVAIMNKFYRQGRSVRTNISENGELTIINVPPIRYDNLEFFYAPELKTRNNDNDLIDRELEKWCKEPQNEKLLVKKINHR